MVDGLLSALDEVTGQRLPGLALLRAIWGTGVVIASFGMAGVMVITPQAPLRVLAPLVLFTWWVGLCQGTPFLHVPHLYLILSVVQVALSVGLWAAFREVGARWWSPFAGRNVPFFRWQHTAVGIPVVAAMFFAAIFVSIFVGFSSELDRLTGGYLRLKPDGLYLTERQFQAGDKQVYLAGMMHVADSDFYERVLPAGDPAQPSVVLVEGVTDSGKLLGSNGLSYGKMAEALKITAQEHSVFTEKIREGLAKEDSQESIVFKRADVDISAFRPQTVTFLLAVGALFNAKDWQDVASQLSNPASPLMDEAAQHEVMQDILVARNDKLTAEIQSSLKDYKRVIVPWGALHLQGIEAWLKKRNFVQSQEIERKALGFW